MRALLAIPLLVLLLAGCSGRETPATTPGPVIGDLDAADITLPAAGSPVLTAIEGGLAAVFANAELPLSLEVTIPPQATLVRAVAESGATSVTMSNLETGRRRCNNPTVEDFSTAFQYPKSCSSIVALDAPNAVWRITFNAPVPQPNPVTGAVDPRVRGDVRIEYLDVAYDGLLAGLDLDAIDKPTRELQSTVVEFLPSHDGVLLRTERTLPQGDGPFPTIIVSSPYYTHAANAPPADWTYVVHDWAKRGYAMVTADVRGFADSGGCVEVWGSNEQLDQKFLVDWVAQQPWSDGNVGFYGQSYVGTTPVAAAVQAPEALKAIVTIAPVINAYEDWHYGGVPNGESELSPLAYQVLTESLVSELPNEGGDDGRYVNDPQQLLNNARNGPCDPTLVTRANDPRATYDDFYLERDFKTRAKDVTAAVLYTEGFEDANVKSAMIPGWFNDLQSTKLGLFGHWLHQHPSRLDCEALFVGWFETHLKGKDLGFDRLPAAVVQVDRETQRHASEWPPTGERATYTTLHADLDGPGLHDDPQNGTTATLLLDSIGLPAQAGVPAALGSRSLSFTYTVPADISLAGVGRVYVSGELFGTNAYLGAYLYEEGRLVTWGRLNVAHNEDHTAYTPVVPGDLIAEEIPLRPTEDILRAGSTVTLVVRGVQAAETTDPFGVVGARLDLDMLALILPGVAMSEYEPISLTARP